MRGHALRCHWGTNTDSYKIREFEDWRIFIYVPWSVHCRSYRFVVSVRNGCMGCRRWNFNSVPYFWNPFPRCETTGCFQRNLPSIWHWIAIYGRLVYHGRYIWHRKYRAIGSRVYTQNIHTLYQPSTSHLQECVIWSTIYMLCSWWSECKFYVWLYNVSEKDLENEKTSNLPCLVQTEIQKTSSTNRVRRADSYKCASSEKRGIMFIRSEEFHFILILLFHHLCIMRLIFMPFYLLIFIILYYLFNYFVIGRIRGCILLWSLNV